MREIRFIARDLGLVHPGETDGGGGLVVILGDRTRRALLPVPEDGAIGAVVHGLHFGLEAGRGNGGVTRTREAKLEDENLVLEQEDNRVINYGDSGRTFWSMGLPIAKGWRPRSEEPTTGAFAEGAGRQAAPMPPKPSLCSTTKRHKYLISSVRIGGEGKIDGKAGEETRGFSVNIPR